MIPDPYCFDSQLCEHFIYSRRRLYCRLYAECDNYKPMRSKKRGKKESNNKDTIKPRVVEMWVGE